MFNEIEEEDGTQGDEENNIKYNYLIQKMPRRLLYKKSPRLSHNMNAVILTFSIWIFEVICDGV